MSYDNLSSVSQNVLKFYRQLTGEERRFPFIFDDFHFCHSRVIGLDMAQILILVCLIFGAFQKMIVLFWCFSTGYKKNNACDQCCCFLS